MKKLITKEDEVRMNHLLDDDIFDNPKSLFENYQILDRQAYRPNKECYQTSNNMQMQMVEMKRKYK